MLLRRIFLLCLWLSCIAMTMTVVMGSATATVKGKETEAQQHLLQKDTESKTTTATQSTIYKIKRLRAKDHSLSRQQQQQQQQQQQHKQNNELKPLATSLLTSSSSSSTMDVAGKPPRTKKQKNLSKNSHGLNKKLLNKMGFIKVKAPNSHNRKRLAVESRRHASRDDSHMFIIKLPPNLYYYTGPKAAASENTKNALLPSKTKDAMYKELQLQHQHQQQQQQQHKATRVEEIAEALNANGKKVSFPFSSNGRPGRIYHWNLPILKKALEQKERFTHLPDATKQHLLDIKDIPTWGKGKIWENETIEKSFSSGSGSGNSISRSSSSGSSSSSSGGGGNNNGIVGFGVTGNKSNYKKSLKPKSPSYYAPMNAVNKNSFNKYFAGNGKPKGFYVIKENQKKPLYYKNIIS